MFSEWIDNGHTDFENENTVILKCGIDRRAAAFAWDKVRVLGLVFTFITEYTLYRTHFYTRYVLKALCEKRKGQDNIYGDFQ